MSNLTPEKQARVDALMRKAKVFYDAILKAKPPTELGIAIRDGVPFDKLKEQSIEAIALTVTLYEKGLTDLVAQLAQMPTPEAKTEPETEPETSPKVPLVPDKVSPPRSSKAESVAKNT